jgi:hypothetical protein
VASGDVLDRHLRHVPDRAAEHPLHDRAHVVVRPEKSPETNDAVDLECPSLRIGEPAHLRSGG